MVLTIARLTTFLGLVGTTAFYWLQTNGHLLVSKDAVNHITVAAVVWALTLIRKRQPKADDALHGSARWATGRDLRGLLRRGKETRPGALVVGRFGRRTLVLPPELATHHALVVGPAGTGKSRAEFMPNAALATGSFVATDPKGELWQ